MALLKRYHTLYLDRWSKDLKWIRQQESFTFGLFPLLIISCENLPIKTNKTYDAKIYRRSKYLTAAVFELNVWVVECPETLGQKQELCKE